MSWIKSPSPLMPRFMVPVWKILVFLVGSLVILLGCIMLVTPGPGLVVIPLGFGILALEFSWADKILQKLLAYLAEAKRRWLLFRKKRTKD